MTFETMAGPIRPGRGPLVKLQLTAPRDLRLDQELVVGDTRYPVDFINTGVPHTVLWVGSWGGGYNRAGPPSVSSGFQPAGTNVNFLREKGADTLSVRTYERGVEGETLACGTGAVASAVVAYLKGRVRSPVPVRTSGGEILTSTWRGIRGGNQAGIFRGNGDHGLRGRGISRGKD